MDGWGPLVSSILQLLICVFYAENWVKTAQKSLPAFFCIFCTWRMSRVHVDGLFCESRGRVSHAYASLSKSSNHAYASVTCTLRHGYLQITRTRQACVCIAPCCHLLLFLCCRNSVKFRRMLPKINKIAQNSK